MKISEYPLPLGFEAMVSSIILNTFTNEFYMGAISKVYNTIMDFSAFVHDVICNRKLILTEMVAEVNIHFFLN